MGEAPPPARTWPDRSASFQRHSGGAGYEEEMLAIRDAISRNAKEKLPDLMSARWLSNVTLYGSASEVREGIEAWYETGVKTLIVVPSSAMGNQMAALQEVIEALR